MKLPDFKLRDWISLVAAVAVGPASLKIGYAMGLIYAAAALEYFFFCAIVVPSLTFIARSDRFKIVTWPLAIASLTVTVIADDLRLGSMPRSEIVSVMYVFWTMGILLSSPLPIYLLLRPLQRRQQNIALIVIGAVALAMWIALKRITG